MSAKDGVVEKLEAENKALQETVAEKEVRAADILQKARSKIMYLLKVSKKHQSEAKALKDRLTTVETALRGKQIFHIQVDDCLKKLINLVSSKMFTDEAVARENVLKSSYENRITKLEKEKTESQAERDRLSREIEVLSQRVNTLQRQLHAQPVRIYVWSVDLCFCFNKMIFNSLI